ncbi:MAG: tRNA (adenosine(37)-N6)-threonylcarbamoyltransferase complex ATPase subunit type 1 TsaE [Thermoclostridium sp.]|nr:tRNA (adenosine(37)-N6)-threonylcarbamoyltransferase complex ATPase subunit type 1 TsaE [Thermoclostridium sp.]
MREYITKNEAETIELGEKLAGQLKCGDILAITGDLGSGKTALVKGIAKELSINDYITSPTFTLVHSYRGSLATLHHFDVYRVSGEDELFDIGFEEYLDSGDICVIEWADLIRPLLPSHTKWIHLERTNKNTDERKISLQEAEI